MVKGVVPTNQINVHVPAVTPIVEHLGGTVDQVVSAVPVVNHVVPPDTAGTVVNTVVAPVTDTVDHTVDVVVPPVNEPWNPLRLEPVTDVVNPIVEPIVDVVDTVLAPVELGRSAGCSPRAGPAGGSIRLFRPWQFRRWWRLPPRRLRLPVCRDPTLL